MKKITVKITVILDRQPDGYYIAACKELPEFLTGGRSIDEVIDNVPDAFLATLEIYEHAKKALPKEIIVRRTKLLSEPMFTTLTPKGKSGDSSTNFWLQATMPAEDSGLYAS